MHIEHNLQVILKNCRSQLTSVAPHHAFLDAPIPLANGIIWTCLFIRHTQLTWAWQGAVATYFLKFFWCAGMYDLGWLEE